MARRRLPEVLICSAVLALSFASAASSAGGANLQPTASDEAAARASVLHAGDFTAGSGWVSTTALSGSSSGPGSGAPGCGALHQSGGGLVETGLASSSFKAPGGLQVWSTATVMRTAQMVQQDWEQTVTPALLPCLRAELIQGLHSRASLVSMGPLPFPKTGDDSIAYRGVVDVPVASGSVRMELDFIAVRRSRLELTLIQMAPFAIASLAKAGEIRMARMLAARTAPQPLSA